MSGENISPDSLKHPTIIETRVPKVIIPRTTTTNLGTGKPLKLPGFVPLIKKNPTKSKINVITRKGNVPMFSLELPEIITSRDSVKRYSSRKSTSTVKSLKPLSNNHTIDAPISQNTSTNTTATTSHSNNMMGLVSSIDENDTFASLVPKKSHSPYVKIVGICGNKLLKQGEILPEQIIISTDGSCTNNHQPDESIRRAGSGVYYGKNDPRNIHARVPGKQTNQASELYAIYLALKNHKHDRIIIYTDSQYSKNVVTKWMHDWKRKGWKNSTNKTPDNIDIIKHIYACMVNMDYLPEFRWVKGHSDDPGNDGADVLAKLGGSLDRVISPFSY